MNTVLISLDPVTCYSCGVVFGIEQGHRSRLLGNGADFYCTNGHRQHYVGETDKAKADRLQNQLHNEQEQTRLARVDAQHAKMLQAQAEEKARKASAKVRRVKRGACPECNRFFQNVADHMATKHKHGT